MAVVYGTPGNDEIFDDYPGRTAGADLVFAGEGVDTLKGVDGPDTLYGEGGTDYIILAYDDLSGGTTFAAGYGGEGDDFLGGGGRIVLSGGAGSDTLAGTETSGDSVYDGGDGVDWAVGFVPVVLGTPDAYVIDLSNSNPEAIEYINVENIRGDELGDLLTGDFRANTILGEEGADTIQGGAGADTLEGGTDPAPEEFQKIDTVTYAGAASGVTVRINGAGTRGDAAGDVLSGFESLVGSEFGDALSSDGGNRTISGLGGADTITGGAGADTLDGGAANDDLDGADGGDSLAGGLGVDTLEGGAGDDVLSGGDSRDLLDGGGDADRLFGDAGADTLRGGAGADSLDGGAGADSMAGGAGDDRYVVDSAGDTVNEAAGGSGVDTVVSSVSFSLSGPRVLGAVENVSLALSGGAIDATGNGLGNRLTGNLYANVLDGMGGADTLQGLGGNDTYYVDRPADVVIESPGGGFDRVFAASRYTLAAGEEIELLAATGAAATDGVTLVGNAFSQSIRGGAGDDVLNAAGGTDTLRGYEGDDRYVVNGADVIIEAANAGFDTLEAYQSYALAAGVSIERMQLTAGVTLTGNAFSQTLVGNAGSNRLDGGGGADRMEGGKGGDTYVVDNAGDVISEAGGNGDDTVETTVSFSLAGARAIGAIENLVLRGGAAINGVGNELSNEIEGNDRANTLNGAGGADTLVGGAGSDRLNGGDGKDWLFGDQGADTMIGGAGADRFYFSFAPGAGGLDTITDFAAGSDTVYLSAAAFGTIGRNGGLGALRPETFHIGSAAADADDRVIYNPANGALLFDADGAGGAAALHFADLDKGLNLNALDFFVY